MIETSISLSGTDSGINLGFNDSAIEDFCTIAQAHIADKHTHSSSYPHGKHMEAMHLSRERAIAHTEHTVAVTNVANDEGPWHRKEEEEEEEGRLDCRGVLHHKQSPVSSCLEFSPPALSSSSPPQSL